MPPLRFNLSAKVVIHAPSGGVIAERLLYDYCV
jgi:hypothetical protein